MCGWCGCEDISGARPQPQAQNAWIHRDLTVSSRTDSNLPLSLSRQTSTPTPPAGKRIPSAGNSVTPWDSEGSTLLLLSLQDKNGMGPRGCPPIWADLLLPACSPGDWCMPPLAWKEAGNFSLLSGLKPHTFFKVFTPALRSESLSRFVLSWALSLGPREMQGFLIRHSYSFIIVWSFLILNFGSFIHHVVSMSCFNLDSCYQVQIKTTKRYNYIHTWMTKHFLKMDNTKYWCRAPGTLICCSINSHLYQAHNFL